MFFKDAIEARSSEKSLSELQRNEFISAGQYLKTRTTFRFESSDKRDTCRGSAIWTIGSKSICFMSSLWLGRDLQKSLTCLQASFTLRWRSRSANVSSEEGRESKDDFKLNTKLHCCLQRLEELHTYSSYSYAVGFLKNNISSRVLCLPS